MRNVSRALLAITLVLLASTPSLTQGPNLIVNGSFEDGDFSPVNSGSWVNVGAGETKLTGWTVGGDLVNWHNSVEFHFPQEGDKTVDLNDGCFGLRGTISQTIATTVGMAYELKFYLSGPINFSDGCSGSLVRDLQVNVGGADAFFQAAASDHLNIQWEEKTATFVATASSTTITFSAPVPGGYWGPVIDNVSVVELGPADTDNDGVPDAGDACAATPAGDIVNASGCSIAQLCPCAGPVAGGAWKNHGQYVSCVSRTSSDFIEAGLLSSSAHGQIVSDAAQSTCGKK
jgi:choice-of-anchor C domain-containing protein